MKVLVKEEEEEEEEFKEDRGVHFAINWDLAAGNRAGSVSEHEADAVGHRLTGRVMGVAQTKGRE
jgi:hypothetical protein